MGLMFGYQDCRKTLSTGWQGREGRRKGREYIHGLDKLCSACESCAILKVRAREKSKFCWLFWCGYTTPVFLPLYLRWFYYSTANCLKIKLENYIIIAKETDFWLPKQACMIVLLISCPSFPFSVLTYCHFLSFFCLDWGFFLWSSLYWPIPERIRDWQPCALGGFYDAEMLVWSLYH